jgi:hypothetical protein
MVRINHGIFLITLWCLLANAIAEKNEEKHQDLASPQQLGYMGVNEEPALVYNDEKEYEDSLGSVENDLGDEKDWSRLLDSTDMSMDVDCRPYMDSESK